MRLAVQRGGRSVRLRERRLHPYSEEEAAKVLAEHDILVRVDMGLGSASAKAWGCDLTYDYVKINGITGPERGAER